MRAAKRPPARQAVPWRRTAAGAVATAMPPVHSCRPDHAVWPTQCAHKKTRSTTTLHNHDCTVSDWQGPPSPDAARPARAPCTGEAFCAEDMMSNPRSAVTQVLSKPWSRGMSIFSPPVPLSRFLASFAARRRSNFSPPKNNNVIQLEDQKLLRRLSYKNTGCHAEPAEYITPRRSDCRPSIRRALRSLAATI